MSNIDSTKLKFGQGNAKLSKTIFTFSLPAGHSCPGAHLCLAKADRVTGKLTDGSTQEFRCFAASAEAAFPSVRAQRWHNFDLLKGKSQDEMTALILESLLPEVEILRLHVSGDFFNEAYFLAWCNVAFVRPRTKFYAYTKSITLWRKHFSEIPSNLILTASQGGKFDAQIGDFKRAIVVYSEEEAAALNLELDHDDSHAYDGEESFALLLHGQQQKGSQAAKSLSALKLLGKGSYSKKLIKIEDNK
jgi:hypothetical protein